MIEVVGKAYSLMTQLVLLWVGLAVITLWGWMVIVVCKKLIAAVCKLIAVVCKVMPL